MLQLLQSLSAFELLLLIGSAVGFVWWMSGMYAETKASRVANQECAEAFKEFKGEVKEVRGEVVDHRGRIYSLEEWRAVVKAREATHSTFVVGADGAEEMGKVKGTE
jgi:hypothetical protein